LDKQFAYPNLFEVKNPFTFLSKSDLFKKRMELHSGKKRPMDNIKVKLDSPSEEEFALAVLSLKSPLISWMFPKNSETYDRYLTFKNASDEDYLEWQNAFIFFLKKLTLKYKKQLLLKSPTNTARIQFLYKLFPEGKFIHIHRNPYNVFKSTKKLFRTAVTTSRLQKPDSNQYDDYIIKLYNEMYDAFFKDRNLLDDGQFIDIAFEDIEAQPLEVIKKIYGDLKIDGFEQMKPDLDNYIQEYSNYEKNKYNEIDDDIRQKIARNCTRNFETWGYEL
jgi:predicted small secreted protein